MRPSYPQLLFFTIALSALHGCGQTPDVSMALEKASFAEELSEELAAPVKSEMTQKSTDQVPLPNPARTNPFLVQAQKLINKETSLTLKGFVHLDNAKAVLDVDSRILVMRAGDENGDLTVLKVEPPSVVYRLGDVERTLTLAR